MRTYRLSFVMLAILFPLTASAQTIRCSSDDGGKNYCKADTAHGVRLAKQVSAIPCTQGVSWGYDERGIWVDQGCSAEFALEAEAPASSNAKMVTCASEGEKKFCDTNTGRGVRLVKQRSEAPCKQGDTWGYDGLGIWVDRGCSADFAVDVAPKPQATTTESEDKPAGSQNVSCLKAVGKARSDQLVKQCLQVSPATHPPCNAQNSCDLITDEIRRSCALLGRDGPGFCNGYNK